MNPHRLRRAFAAAFLPALALSSALARNEALTARTEGGATEPISVFALESPLPRYYTGAPAGERSRAGRLLRAPRAAAGGVVAFDLTMSIPDDPAGDYEGNTQDVDAGSAEQDQWEKVVREFAAGVFEMSEGRHCIRKVRIFRKGRFAQNADVVWGDEGGPRCEGGIGKPGGVIRMYKDFSGTDLLGDPLAGGLTLAHEWGHYFYGMYDEYDRPGHPNDTEVQNSIMSTHWNALNSANTAIVNRAWLNFSIPTNGGVPFRQTLINRQGEVHGVSAWETFARDPADDPVKGSLAPRILYPEMMANPRDDANPPVSNIGGLGQLDIVWVQKLVFELVIDDSGSMAGAPLANAKAAAKALVLKVPAGETRIGVVRFSDSASVLLPVTDVDGFFDKLAINDAIDDIAAGGQTAIGDGAQLGLAQVTAAATEGDTKFVFLLSDGVNNEGVDPLSVLPAFRAAQVPLFTFAFGSSADVQTLQTMALQTGGRFYNSPTSLFEIIRAYLDAFFAASSEPVLTDAAFSARPGRGARSSFPVDSGLASLQVSAAFPRDAVAIQLRAPDGTLFDPPSVLDTANESLATFEIGNPQPGPWHVVATSTGFFLAPVTYQVGGAGRAGGIHCTAFSLEGGNVAFPAPVIVQAKVAGDRPIAGATIAAGVLQPDGRTVALRLADDGRAPDELAGDGTHSGYFFYTQNGVHEFGIRAENRRRRARFTSRGTEQAPPPPGQTARVERDVSVGQNFIRQASFTVTTGSGVFAQTRRAVPAGSYAGAIGAGGEGHENNGLVRALVSKGGSLSGALSYEGEIHRFRSRFNDHGAFATTIVRRGRPPLQLLLVMDLNSDFVNLRGTLSDGGAQHAFTLDPGFNNRANPTRLAGAFTALLEPEAGLDPAVAPAGTGFAVIQVRPAGEARFAGKLADGSPFAGSAPVILGDQLPIYVPLYRGRGSLRGTIEAAFEIGVADARGTLAWSKLPTPGNTLYPAGFTTAPEVVVSRYRRPPRGGSPLRVGPGADNARIEFTAGNLPAPETQSLSLGAGDRVLPGSAADFQMRVAAASGLITGRSSVGAFHGVVLHAQNRGGGFFLGATQAGRFALLRRVPAGPATAHVATGLPIAIPDDDEAGIASRLDVTQPGAIADARLAVSIAHTFRGDLRVTLVGPTGLEMPILVPNGDGANDVNLSGFDAAEFLSQPASGTWELRIADETGADTGTLNAWSLQLITQ